jgi:hypothetical protein
MRPPGDPLKMRDMQVGVSALTLIRHNVDGDEVL